MMHRRLAHEPPTVPAMQAAAPAHKAITALQALALGVLLAQSWRLCRHTLERRRTGRPQAKPQPLQTWEGEGGQHEPPVTTALMSGHPAGTNRDSTTR